MRQLLLSALAVIAATVDATQAAGTAKISELQNVVHSVMHGSADASTVKQAHELLMRQSSPPVPPESATVFQTGTDCNPWGDPPKTVLPCIDNLYQCYIADENPCDKLIDGATILHFTDSQGSVA